MISDIGNFELAEQYMYKSLVIKCSKSVHAEGIPVKEAVKKIVEEFGSMVSDPKNLRKVLLQEVTQEHCPHTVIKSADARNRHWWTDFNEKRMVPLDYWRRYQDYLTGKPGWSSTSVADIDNSTDEIMNAIADPTTGQADERRGLVYGDVQSGKTAHYIGLINKAFCAGYKIIIVLSGMQNSLRSQTQSRIDEEVLGYETSNEMKELQVALQNSIGVGTITPTADIANKLQSLTNRDENGDFNTGNSIGSYMPPYIIVTKKVKAPLLHIIASIQKSTITKTDSGKKYVPANIPALIIDDEADQASINTKKMTDSEEDPTTINGLIRKLLNLFQCKSYVGYTATPFANIFIPHRVQNDIYGKDLFPKDFIAKSPRPDLYIGAREFFGLGDSEDVPSMPLIRQIKEGADFLPRGTKKDDSVGELPKELKDAVKYFMISTAVRNLRGQRNKPNTMLVHIVRFVNQQNILKRKIVDFKKELFSYIKFGDIDVYSQFKDIFNDDYISTTRIMKSQFSKFTNGCIDIDFDTVWEEIKRIVDKDELKVWAVNGKSTDSLMYKNYGGMPFNVIAIGGDKLSRGLTLEGLTVSYFTRSAGAMDTLMQMGRWFGYRPGYIDVCRLFTTEELSTKFEIISYSVSNLSAQFDDMNTVNSDPEHFGLKVATDPSILISARNKVRTGEDYQSDFSGSLTQTRLLDADSDSIENNYAAVNNLTSSLDQNRLDIPGKDTYVNVTGRRSMPAGKTFWIHVSGTVIADFFDHYRTSRTAAKASSKHIADYIREMNNCGGTTDWTVCLAGVGGQPTSMIATDSAWPIGVHGVERNKTKNREKDIDVNDITRDLHVLTSAGDEELDLSDAEKTKADDYRAQLIQGGRRGQAVSTAVRKKVRSFKHGFLLLYPIEKAAPDLKTENNKAPYAFAVVFPDRNGKGNLKSYKLNEVAVELDDE